jgi:hypothetical protein
MVLALLCTSNFRKTAPNLRSALSYLLTVPIGWN